MPRTWFSDDPMSDGPRTEKAMQYAAGHLGESLEPLKPARWHWAAAALLLVPLPVSALCIVALAGYAAWARGDWMLLVLPLGILGVAIVAYARALRDCATTIARWRALQSWRRRHAR